MHHQELYACLGLLRQPSLGPTALARALLATGSPLTLLGLPHGELEALGLKAAAIDTIQRLNGRPDPAVDAVADALAIRQIATVAIHEPDYPPQLLQIARPPPVLFVRGRIQALHGPQLAMVGSRKPTPGGRRVARQLAKALAKYGLTITSGLAIGIDTESHWGAVEAGCSIAVMGTGPDLIYPRSNRELADSILARDGALVSEFLPGTCAEAANFPRRNRIISGLSLGVLVVEAALPSGSLLTAQYAAEQNREVMAVPGSILSGVSRGCHMLLRNGAALVESAEDALIAVGDRFKPAVSPADVPTRLPGNAAPVSLSADQREVLAHTGFEKTTLDVIADASGLSAAAAAAAITVLELHGLVTPTAGGYARTG
jgi:DNA processing protein